MNAGSLARFQDAFVRSLLAPEGGEDLAFKSYRNTVVKGCIDALQANFPAVARLVGDEWFRAAAAIYARRHPPEVPMLVEYGAGFADFLARFEPAAELPYLPAAARLDRFWSESHIARDEPPLRADALAMFSPAQLAGAVLRPHAAARWAWFDVPAYTIWSRNRLEAPGGIEQVDIEWRAEGALLVRPADAVVWNQLSQAGCAFLDACAAGRTLARAAEAALTVSPATGLAALLARLLDAGAFAHQDY